MTSSRPLLRLLPLLLAAAAPVLAGPPSCPAASVGASGLAALGAAFAVGLLVGRVLPRSRRPDPAPAVPAAPEAPVPAEPAPLPPEGTEEGTPPPVPGEGPAAGETDRTLVDALTGLRSRRFLNVCMPADVASVQRHLRDAADAGRHGPQANMDLAFVMMDLDHFRQVNDRFGHAAGDRIIQRTAEILRRATRETDTVIRWGGEEFLVVARNVTQRDVPVMVERIRARVAAEAFDVGEGRTLQLTCSLGFAHYPFFHGEPDLYTWERVVDLADHCLYTVKRGGRDAWVGLYAEEGADADRLRQGLPFRIPALLEQGQVKIRTNRPDGHGLDWDLHISL